jgi:hypothetical protein
MKSAQTSQAIVMKMSRDHRFNTAMQFLFYPPDQFIRFAVMGGCIKNDGLVSVSYNQSVAGYLAKIVGLLEGCVHKRVFGYLFYY